MEGVPTILRMRCNPNFLLNTPDLLSRERIYWPQRHFPWVTISCVGIDGTFQPIVFDNFRVTASPTLLKRRRADSVETSVRNDDECSDTGKLNLRLDSSGVK